jgi:hypothetical protein
MYSRALQCGVFTGFFIGCKRSAIRRALLCLSTLAMMASTAVHSQGFVPPQNLSNEPALDSTYTEEAWLLYTYAIDVDGSVVDAKIHISNGVTAVEQKFLNHVEAMRFRPGTRNGSPVRVTSGVRTYTWILDHPREVSAEFDAIYQQAWAEFKLENYDGAFDLARELQNRPGRNAYEEIKFQILAASLASRWEDEVGELANLKRIVEFQSLADRNRFANPYVEDGQYMMILERIHSLQTGMNTLADAKDTLDQMIVRDRSSQTTVRAQEAHQAAELQFAATPDVTMKGELTPRYRGDLGKWERKLSRGNFSISGVKGKIDSLYLACKSGGDKRLRYPSTDPWTTPQGWRDCKIEIAGKAGTRFTVHQLAP